VYAGVCTVPLYANPLTVPTAWREAVEEFVQRVEAGEIRSSYTYTKFKKLLEAI
jgi:hypothetical protein